MSEAEKCGAKLKGKRAGELCQTVPVKGARRCRQHGGSSPQAKAKARERIIEADARQILGRIDPKVSREHPVEMLMNLIWAKDAEVAWLRGRVQSLNEDDLVWGKTQTETGVNSQGPVDVTTYKAEVSVWYKLLRDAENQLANWITMAQKAGVDERRVRIAESQGASVAKAIKAILDALDLSADQWERVPLIVPQVLRALTDVD